MTSLTGCLVKHIINDSVPICQTEKRPGHLGAAVPGTGHHTYEALLEKHVLPSLGHLKLSRIQPAHLNKLYNAMLKERRDGRLGGYSPTTVKRVHALGELFRPKAPVSQLLVK